MGADESFSIDELAQAAGMTARNVRAYTTKGLLQPPIRTGRASQYRAAHLQRLRHVLDLREAGLPLNLIAEAARRGEDLGPEGPLRKFVEGTPIETDGSERVTDADRYPAMTALRQRGLPSALVLLVSSTLTERCRAMAREAQLTVRTELPAARVGDELTELVLQVAGDVVRGELGGGPTG